MKISIVTIAYNSAATIEDTINSVLAQEYPDLEYIVKDGGSTDGTIDLLKKYENRLKWVSTKDKGIYDGMNQGLQLATGEVIGILNSDDFYAHSQVLKNVAEVFQKKNVDAMYADLEYVDFCDTQKVIRKWQSGEYNQQNFLKGWMPPHPTFFLRSSYYQKYGYFDPAFRSAGDYELMLRMLFKFGLSAFYLPQTIIKMRAGGVSNLSLKNRIRANKEDRAAWKINGLKPRWYTLWWKPLSKIFQWLH